MKRAGFVSVTSMRSHAAAAAAAAADSGGDDVADRIDARTTRPPATVDQLQPRVPADQHSPASGVALQGHPRS